jgi:heat shock protein HtpX
MNYTKTALLLVIMTGILVAMGGVVGGQGGMLIAFIIALAMNLFSLWNADTMVLRMFRARPVDEASAPQLYAMVRELAARAELPMPRVYLIDNPQPNAFATGRSPARSAVAVSSGLLDVLEEREVAGVIAHELAHIKNRDTLTMTVAATIGGAISMLAQYLQVGMIFGSNRNNNGNGGVGFLGALVVMIAAPFAATLVQLAISRSREYQADRMGAMIVGNPLWLASALSKIQTYAKRIRNDPAEAAPGMAHLFIINPLTGRGVDSWFTTHPSTENRIAELEALARELQSAGHLPADNMPAPRDQSASPWGRQPPPRGSSGPWG